MMAEEVIHDALPYVDKDFEEPARKKLVLGLIDEEIEQSGGRDKLLSQYLMKLTNNAEHLPLLESPKPLQVIDLNRYELQTEATKENLDRACVILEYEYMKNTNLQVMTSYGKNAYKNFAKYLDEEIKQESERLKSIKEYSTIINFERKTEQEASYVELQELNEQWGSLTYKVASLRGALTSLVPEHLNT